MSLKAMRWAWVQQCPSALAKLLLLRLADHANKVGECWPAFGQMAKDCGIDRRTAIRHLKNLEKAGLLAIHRDEGKRNHYVLTSVSLPPVTSGTQTPVSNSHPGGGTQTPTSVSLPPEPITNHYSPTYSPPPLGGDGKHLIKLKVKTKRPLPVDPKLLGHGDVCMCRNCEAWAKARAQPLAKQTPERKTDEHDDGPRL